MAGALLLIGLLFALRLEARSPLKTRTFKTEFLSFNLSNQWDCAMDKAEYVCRPVSKVKMREAIIIIAAKIPGKEDNLKAYYDYLKRPKEVVDFKGRSIASKVNLIKHKEIKSTQWVDAIHLSGELPNFYTRYLATVKNGIAILVTYSVAKTKHALYAAELNRMVASIEVIAKPPQIAAPPEKEKPQNIITGDREKKK